MVFEDVFDALRHTVQRSGGAKEVGSVLFPGKSPDQAARYLLDCLNTARPEKLDLEHVITLIRIGRKHGCHEIMGFLAETTGYATPTPITSAEERAELQRQYIDAADNLQRIFRRVQGMEEHPE